MTLNKLYIALTFNILITCSLFAQVTSEQLVTLNSVNTAEMNTLISPTAGALVFNTDINRVYEFDGTNWLQIAIEDSVVNTQTGNYTLTLADQNNIVDINNGATNVTITIPPGLPIGYKVNVFQRGTGIVTIATTGVVNMGNRLSRTICAGQNAGFGIVAIAADSYILTGDLRQ